MGGDGRGGRGSGPGDWRMADRRSRMARYISRNIPLALGAILLALGFIQEPRGTSEKQSLDFAGGLLATLALGALTWGLTIGSGHRGWTLTAQLALAAGVVLSAAFIWIEKIRGERAMMPLALFRSTSFVGLSLLTFLLYGALGGLLVLLPYVLIEVGRYSGTAAGAACHPWLPARRISG